MEYRFSGTVKLGGVGAMSAEAEEALGNMIDAALAVLSADISHRSLGWTSVEFPPVHLFLSAPEDTGSL